MIRFVRPITNRLGTDMIAIPHKIVKKERLKDGDVLLVTIVKTRFNVKPVKFGQWLKKKEKELEILRHLQDEKENS